MKKFFVFLMTIVLVFAGIITTYAANSMELKVSQNIIKVGDEITVSLDFEGDETTLYAYSAKLSYDKDVFEVIEEDNFEESENWSDITYNKINNKFALINKKGSSGKSVLQINLKVKEDAVPGKTNITVNSVKASDGKNDISLKGSSVEVTVIKEGLAEGESIPTNKDENIISEEETSIEVKKEVPIITYIFILLIILVGVLAFIYYIKSNENGTPKKKRNTIIIIAILIMIALFIVVINLFANRKVDVNKDGKVDYDDAKDIIEYLLEIKNPEEDENLSDKDLNKDGQITITDVAVSTNQATNQDYSANVSGQSKDKNNNTTNQGSSGNQSNTSTPSEPSDPENPNNPSSPEEQEPDELTNPDNPSEPSNPEEPTEPDNQGGEVKPDEPSKPVDPGEQGGPVTPSEPEDDYLSVIGNAEVTNLTPKKEENITLDLYIDVVPYTVVEEIEIDGVFYKVEKVTTAGINNHYRVNVLAPSVAGVQSIKITRVKLDNNKTISAKYSVTVDVLKDKPRVENFKIDDKQAKPEISFNFVDPDGALNKGKFVITDEEGNIVFETESINVGENKFQAELEDGKIYHYDFIVDYDLDHNYFDENTAKDFKTQEDFIDDIFENKDGNIEFTREYGFTSKDMTLTSKVSKDDELILSFENEQYSYYDVKYVYVDGKQYPVENENGKYIVRLEKTDEKGLNSITVEKAVLENGYEETVNKVFDYIYLNDEPKIEILNAECTDNKLSVSLDIQDEDNTLLNAKVYITDEDGNIIEEKVLEKDEKIAEFDFNKVGKYKVKVEYTYDIGDGTYETKTKEYEKTIICNVSVKIISCKIIDENGEEVKYVKKNQKITAIYKIETNLNENVTSITVNSIELPVTKNEDGSYSVTFNAPKDAGKTQLVASKVGFMGNEEADATYSTEIEVLKSIKPSVSNIIVDDKTEKPVLTYTLQDEEDTFVSGKIIITDMKTNESQEIKIEDKEVTSYTLDNIKELTKYEVKFEFIYDFDEDKTNTDNQGVQTIDQNYFEIIKDYQFKVEDFKVTNVDTVNKKIKLQFTSTNITDNRSDYEPYYLTEVTINGKIYPVTREEKTYKVTVPYEEETKLVLELQKAKLNNLHEFEDIQKSVTVFKTVPTATVKLSTDSKQSVIEVAVDIIDQDDTITSVEARLINESGETVLTQPISKDTDKVSFQSNSEMFEAGEYTVKIVASYDAVDGKTHYIEEVIGSDSITIETIAEIEKAEVQNYYVEKGGNVNIKYTIKSNNSSKFTGIIVNDVFYSGTQSEDGSYIVSIPVQKTEYGNDIITVKIAMFGKETVILENETESEYFVLKNRPSIDDFTFNEFTAEQTLKFNFNNSENSIIRDAVITLTDETGEKYIKQTLIENAENTVELKDLDNGTYMVSLEGTFDLDDNDDEENRHQLSEIFEPRAIKVTSRYEAQLNITKVEVRKQEKFALITFESTNSSDLEVKEIVLSTGEKIEAEKVSSTSNTYTAKIPYTGEERQTYTVKSVVLDHDINVDLEENINYTIFKIAPTVTDVKTTLNNDTLHIDFKLNDEENIATNLTVVVKNSASTIISKTEISKDMGSIDIPNITKADTYIVEFLADYDRVDGEKHTQEKINSNDITAEVETKVTVTLNKENLKTYYKKNEEFTLNYNITSNAEKPITAIIINGEQKEFENENFAVKLNAPNSKGEASFTVTGVVIDGKEIKVNSDESNLAKIYVLKDAPVIDGYSYDLKAKTIKFNVTNIDEAIIKSGKAIIQNLGGVEVFTKDLVIGENIIDLSQGDYEQSKIYKLVLSGTYDLDDTADDINSYQLSELFTGEEFQLAIETKVLFDSFSTKYPKRGENVDIIFSATTNTQIPITEIYVNGSYYTVTPVETGKYKILYKAKDQAGIEELEVSKVKHGNNEIDVEPKKDVIDVLRLEPEVKEDYKIDTNYNERTVTIIFNLEDKDDAIIENSSYVTFGNFKDAEGREKSPVVKGENTVTFKEVTQNQAFTLKVISDYDLDTDKQNSENHFTGKELLSTEVTLIAPNDVEITDIKANNPDTGLSSRYLDKNKAFKLRFTAKIYDVSAGERKESEYYPVSATIDGIDYELDKDGNIYTTKIALPGYDSKGEKEITIEKLTLNNKEVIEENAKGTVEVLKDKIIVSEFKVNIDSEAEKATAIVEMVDDDESFVSGKIVLTDVKNEEPEKEISINKNQKEYELDVTPFKKYKAELFITYDLDINQTVGSENYVSNESFGTTDVELLTDYKLKVSDLNIIKVDQTTRTVKLEFKATNLSDYKITFVKVKGKEDKFGVGYDENTGIYTFEYEFSADVLENYERTEIELESVTLENETDINVTDELKVVIFKNKPIVTNLVAEAQENMKIQARYDIEDTDSTLKYLYVVLRDLNGNEIGEKVLEPNSEGNFDKEVSFDILTPGKYYVVVKGYYDVADGLEHIKDELKVTDNSVEIKINAEILDGKVSNKYPEKNELIDIEYKIASNISARPTKLVIKGTQEQECDITPSGEAGTYKVSSYQVPDVAGLTDILVNEIKYEGGQSVKLDTPYEIEVDVLKDIPTFTLNSQDMINQGEVVFTIGVKDPDHAMTSGKANVHEENRELISNDTITMPVKVEVDTSHTLLIDIEYDRDSNTIVEETNQNVGRIYENRIFSLTSDYGLEISNLRIVKKDTSEIATYVKKGETIQIRFNSKNKTELLPNGILLNDKLNENIPGVLYEVKKIDGESDGYYVDLTASTSAGIQEFEIESIMLSSGKEIKEEQISFDSKEPIRVTVLKDIPTIDKYNSTNNENSVTVSFTITDTDKALKPESKIRLINDLTNKEVKSFAIKEGENTHTFTDLEPGVSYTIRVENRYSLSEDGNNDSAGTFKEEKVLIAKKDEPNFKVKNLTISDRVKSGTKVQLSFENVVMSYKDVDKITIDGTEYDVSKDDKGVYRLELEPIKKGRNTINIQNAKIGDMIFDINRPLSYTYEFIVPEAIDVTEIIEDGGKAIIKYKLIDPDKSIKSITAYMKNSSGSTAATALMENYSIDPDVENTAEMPLLKLNSYSIELRATCDIGDGRAEDKNLIEKSKISPPQVAILENEIDKEYVEKGEIVTLKFKINTNVDNDVKKIYINGDGYNVQKVTQMVDGKVVIVPDTYEVILEAPKEAGVFPQKVTGVQIGNNLVDENEDNGTKLSYSQDIQDKIVPIKVLKDTPTLTHFIVNEQDRNVTFKINDEDGALSKTVKSKLTVKQGESVVGGTELDNGKVDYKLGLQTIGMTSTTYPTAYNVVVNSTYDRRPDATENISWFKKILNFLNINNDSIQTIAEENSTESEEEEPAPEEPKEGIRNEDIFNQDIKLTGNIKYTLDFEDVARYYQFFMKIEVEVQFDCSTGTEYKAEKVIIDGIEYPVEIIKDFGNNKYRYQTMFLAKDVEQNWIHYDKIILENGAAIDINQEVPCMVKKEDPTFSLTGFTEDTKERKVRFTYKLVDDDKKLAANPTFTLKDSQGTVLESIQIADGQDMVEFNIPDPPTSVYNLIVTAPRYEATWSDYTTTWVAYNDFHESSVTTSILSSEISNKYPKKGETIEIIYNISSTKVIVVDKEDHSNQDKAVSITKLIINDKEYDAETVLDYYGNFVEKYRVYYTVKDDEGIEDINVSKILFSNGYEENFLRTDKIDVLKDMPKITNFSAENNIVDKKVTFKFNVSDEDNVIINDDEDIWAEVNGNTQKVVMGDNSITFDIDKLDELYEFKINATYDLDSDQLQTDTDDNSHTGETIFEKTFALTGEYGIDFNNIRKFNSNGIETDFFEKNEEMRITFVSKTKWSEIYPETITINGNSYIPERVDNQENTYAVTLNADESAGIKELVVNSVGLNSGNTVLLADQKTTYEVLKDPVTVSDFDYTIGSDNDKVDLQIKIKDDDNAYKDFSIEIKDENDKIITPSTSKLYVGENILDFTRTTAGKYFVSIYSSYDRDTNDDSTENYVDKERIHYEIITVNTRYIEMKDIVDIELYTYNKTGNAERVDSLTKDNLQVLDNCIVKVSMKDMPEFYSNITKYTVDGNKIKLVLAYTDAMVYTGSEELKPLEVSLDLVGADESSGYQYENSFKSLVDEMRTNPSGKYELTKDYDIAEYAANNDDSTAIIDFEFTGILNGNGHSIYNLRKPLFNILKDATIDNLVIDGPVPKLNRDTAILVKTADNTSIRNVHIQNPICAYINSCATIAQNAKNHTLIENCSVTNITGNYDGYAQLTSGMVVNLYSSTIRNCVLQGKISGGWHFNAAFVEQADKDSEISNNIINVNYNPSWSNSMGSGNGVLLWNVGDALLKNNLCLTLSGNATSLYHRGTPANDSINNYYLTETTSPKTPESTAVKSISKDDINADFFKNELKFSSDIWNIPEDASFNNLPTLKGVSSSFSDEGEQPENTEVYIPDYNRVSTKLDDYDGKKEIAYNNMYKLMPFYDAKELINDGNKISVNDDLNKKLIKYVIPYNKSGKMVTYLSTENYNSLDKIRIVFVDGSSKEYHIDFDDYYGNVASYMISDLKIGYNYNRYVVDTNSKIVKDLIEEASKYEFTRDLEPLTVKIEEDSRLYKEHFNKVTKNQIPEFVINSLVNLNYSPNFESDLLNTKIKEEIIDTGKLKLMLFAYNYFTYWYNLDMQGVNVADVIMFQANQMFDHRMTLDNMATNLIKESNSATNATANFYNNSIANLTKCSNLGLFLDNMVTRLTSFEDGNDWFKSIFKGGIYETVSIDKDGVDYTIWDHVKKDGKVQTDLLPALTVPENSMFIVSSPTQVYFGSLRVYMTNPNDPNQIKTFKEGKLALFKEQIKQFYMFGYNLWGKETLNKYCDVQYDMRTTYTGRGVETVYNNPLSTEENYHKYFIEAIGRWAGTSGGAYANGNEVFWNVIKMVDNFRVGTHETLHNQDNKIFMNGYGRRGGAEDYAAGFIQQYYRDGWMSPNVFDEEPAKDNVSQNLYRSSVDNDEKILKFYRNYFRTNDFLDWLEAQAFFTLSDTDKAKLVTQVSYPKVSQDKQEEGDTTVAYSPLTEDAVKKMNLNSMEKLWDNHIMLRPGTKQTVLSSDGAGTDSIFNIHWYQPHSDNGRPDGPNFKYLAWQMAGEKGYYNGLIAYYSLSYVGKMTGNPNLKTTDLIALRYITGNDQMTYRTYKLDRYKELSKYDKMEGEYINANEIYEAYVTALQADANRNDKNLTSSTEVKRRYFRTIRGETNDFTIDPFTTKSNADIKETSIQESVSIDETENIASTLEKTREQEEKKQQVENIVTNNVNITVEDAINETEVVNEALENVVPNEFNTTE